MTRPATELSVSPVAYRSPQSSEHRLRARRLRLSDLELGHVWVEANHASLGRIQGRVQDLSLNGIGISMDLPEDSIALAGDRLTELEVSCESGELHRGHGTVRRVNELDGKLLLGVELERPLDLSFVYRVSSQAGFSERLQAALATSANDRIFTEFKSWIADLRGFLDQLKSFLAGEEAALSGHDLLTQTQTREAYLEEASTLIVEKLNVASQELQDFASRLHDSQHSHYKAYFRSQLGTYLLESPLLRRAFEKPLGYAGDYEMMNMLYRSHAEGSSLFAQALNIYAAQETAAQANINRLDYLSKRLIEQLDQSEGPLRIASIGCGPAREISLLIEREPQRARRLEVALIDQESRAMDYCARTLGKQASDVGIKIDFIEESIRRLLTAKKLSTRLGTRELIYSAGLFDYLNLRSFVALMTSLYEALAPGGQLIIGNVAANNPSRFFMEYALEWYLIHRSPEDLETLAASLTPTPAKVQVDCEPLGVNLFLRIWK